jgi:hypothetical protein
MNAYIYALRAGLDGLTLIAAIGGATRAIKLFLRESERGSNRASDYD